MTTRAHVWGNWTKSIPNFDSLGNRLMLAGRPWDSQAELSGAATPVTPGWSRTCRCGAIQHATQ